MGRFRLSLVRHQPECRSPQRSSQQSAEDRPEDKSPDGFHDTHLYCCGGGFVSAQCVLPTSGYVIVRSTAHGFTPRAGAAIVHFDANANQPTELWPSVNENRWCGEFRVAAPAQPP